MRATDNRGNKKKKRKNDEQFLLLGFRFLTSSSEGKRQVTPLCPPADCKPGDRVVVKGYEHEIAGGMNLTDHNYVLRPRNEPIATREKPMQSAGKSARANQFVLLFTFDWLRMWRDTF